MGRVGGVNVGMVITVVAGSETNGTATAEPKRAKRLAPFAKCEGAIVVCVQRTL